MNTRYSYATSFLMLLLESHVTDVFSLRPKCQFLDSYLTFIHFNSSPSRSSLDSSSIGNIVTNTAHLSNDRTQWEKWQIGQGEVGIINKHSLTEWLDGTFYEQYWETQLASMFTLSVNKRETKTATHTLKVNGHTFLGRMAIYKYLIQDWEKESFHRDVTTTTSLEQLWGSKVHEGHWLWAYGAQLDWQYRSLRLSERSVEDRNTCDITPDGTIASSSWWGYMNFCFSVAILLGAINYTDLKNVGESNSCCYNVVLDQESQKLLEEDSACQKCVLIWQHLFSNVYPIYCKKIQSATIDGHIDEETLQLLRFQFQQEVWKTHVHIIETALNSPRSKDLLMLLPVSERKFGLGWARMVDILAASNFPTDLITVVKDGTGFLPFRIITDQVVAGWYDIDKSTDGRSFPEQCHQRAVETTHQLVVLDDKVFNLVVKFWRRVVRNIKVSRYMPSRVNRLVHGSRQDKIMEFGRIIILFLRP